MKPTVKEPGPKRLKLECDEPLSNFAFNFNLHRYIEVEEIALTESATKVAVEADLRQRALQSMRISGGGGGTPGQPLRGGTPDSSSGGTHGGGVGGSGGGGGTWGQPLRVTGRGLHSSTLELNQCRL